MLSFARSGRSAHTAAPKPRRSPASAPHAAPPRAPELRRAPCACGGGCPRCRGETGAGSKLTISEPGDIHEREADRIAGAIVGGAGPTALASARPTPLLQRQAEHHAAPQAAPPSVHDVLNTSGRPLDAATRAFMEPRFGQDFGAVRVHADARAAQSAAAVGAAAYTVGRDIVFGEGQFAPASAGGRHLLAHELAHVVQQEEAPSAPKLMRTIAYDADCAAIQDAVHTNVPRAQATAVQWARGAMQALRTPTDAASLLRRHFNVSADDSAKVAQIRNVFEVVAGLLDSDAFTYHCRPATDPSCQSERGPYAGYAYPGTHDIYFCDPLPRENVYRVRTIHEIVLHEAVHAHNASFNHDSYYYETGYPGPDALTNADSYSTFARDVSFGNSQVNLELTGGMLWSAQPQFYIAAGLSGVGGPAWDIFNLKLGVRTAYMPGTEEQGSRLLGTFDLGLRLNPFRERIYVDVTTGAYLGVNFDNHELMAGIANRISAGYRGEEAELGLDVSQFYDLVGDQDLLIVGVRGGWRF